MNAEVRPVDSGSKTLKDAINEAIRDWVSNVKNTHYLLGSVVGPHPYPMIVRDFQSIIGREARMQVMAEYHRLPDYLVACVGGGSNSIGLFHPFYNDKDVKFIGVDQPRTVLIENLAFVFPDGQVRRTTFDLVKLAKNGRFPNGMIDVSIKNPEYVKY